MKAIIHTRYGPPEVVKLLEINKPQPKDNEVLVKVYAATVNRTDSGFRSAEYVISRLFSGIFRPKHQTLGNEFAGTIEAIGNKVSTFNVGDKVFGYNDISFGAHAEYLVMCEDASIVHIPGNLTFDQAACLSEGGHYALCDIRAANVKPGQNVMVYGATGAIGSAAVQLLKHFGARVTAVGNTKNVELIRSLGADKVIDYTTDDYTHTNERYDFIFDAVGKSSFGRCKPILKEKGIYISTELGKNWENIFFALFTPIWGKKKVLFPIPTINKQDLLFLKELAEKDQFMPVIDRYYALEDIIEAYKYVESGQKTGNVVLKVVQSQS
jgi:NADPH:quinone reductase-like Zn-dependent oxidoreductase